MPKINIEIRSAERQHDAQGRPYTAVKWAAKDGDRVVAEGCEGFDPGKTSADIRAVLAAKADAIGRDIAHQERLRAEAEKTAAHDDVLADLNSGAKPAKKAAARKK